MGFSTLNPVHLIEHTHVYIWRVNKHRIYFLPKPRYRPSKFADYSHFDKTFLSWPIIGLKFNLEVNRYILELWNVSKSSFRVILGQEDLFLYCFSDLGEKRTVAHINLPLCSPPATAHRFNILPAETHRLINPDRRSLTNRQTANTPNQSARPKCKWLIIWVLQNIEYLHSALRIFTALCSNIESGAI